MAKMSFSKPASAPAAPKTNPTPAPKQEPPTVDVDTEVHEEAPPQAAEPATKPVRPLKPVKPTAPAKPAVQEPASEPAAPSQVPARREVSGGLVKEGSDWISFEDIVLPRINLAQRVGDVGENFENGSIVLAKTIVIGDTENPAKMVFIGFREPQYVTVVKGGLGEILSRQEFENLNGTTSREEAEGDDSKVLCQKLYTALVAVKAPEGADEGSFPYQYEPESEEDAHLGGYYALAFCSFKGGSYHECAKLILSHRRIGPLRSGFTARLWDVHSVDKTYKMTGNKAFAFKLGKGVPTSEAFRSWIASVLEVSRDADGDEG